MKTFIYSLLLVLSLLTNTYASAATLSASGDEVYYQYEVTFRSLIPIGSNPGKAELYDAAKDHSEHVFGLFHSPDIAVRYGIPEDLVEGFAGTKDPEIVAVMVAENQDASTYKITYRASANMLVMKPVLRGWIGDQEKGTVELPMFADFTQVYKADKSDYANPAWEKCTDEHYNAPSDFSYFYNPFRCPELGQPPVATNVTLALARKPPGEVARTKMPIEELRGDNGNGELVMIYFINGFYENPESGATIADIRKDDGWKLYSSLNESFVKKFGFERMPAIGGKKRLKKVLADILATNPKMAEQISAADYKVTQNHNYNRTYFSTFVKKQDGKTYVIRMNLSNTENTEKLKTFPKFWKEAWENGDFIYYGGHSGDGYSMDPDVMQDQLNDIYDDKTKLPVTKCVGVDKNKKCIKKKPNYIVSKEPIDNGNIKFQTDKTQIMLFDACSSYAHYQSPYKKLNPKLHLMTYGLVSLFHLAKVTVETLVDMVLNQKTEVLWTDALARIEQNQLIPHMEFLYDLNQQEVLEDEDYQSYKANGQNPGLLLNVSVPEL